MRIQNKAEVALKQFEFKNGKYVFKSNTPDWLTGMAYELHKGMLPDNYKFEYFHEALNLISECSDTDDIEVEADSYTKDLLNWIGSNLGRIEYVDDAKNEYDAKDFVSMLSTGQYIERKEILDLTINALNELDETEVA